MFHTYTYMFILNIYINISMKNIVNTRQPPIAWIWDDIFHTYYMGLEDDVYLTGF